MARIRSLKPDFFTDEDLAELPFYSRLFYAGLWTEADKAGRLEDRPKQLKVKIMPYDKIDIEAILQMLAKPKTTSGNPYILRYEANGERYIQILAWGKHQKPHPSEKESKIPVPSSEDNQIHVKYTLDTRYETQGREGKGKEGKGKEDVYVDFEKSTVISWNSFCDRFPVLSKVTEISGDRRARLKKRFEKESFRQFDKILSAIEAQGFCRGENDRGWKVSFDWLIKNDTNYLKVLEMKYMKIEKQSSLEQKILERRKENESRGGT